VFTHSPPACEALRINSIMLSFLDALCARLHRVVPGAAAALNAPLTWGRRAGRKLFNAVLASLSTIVLASGAHEDNMITTLNNKICQHDCIFRHQHKTDLSWREMDGGARWPLALFFEAVKWVKLMLLLGSIHAPHSPRICCDKIHYICRCVAFNGHAISMQFRGESGEGGVMLKNEIYFWLIGFWQILIE
jgi:hypothetical protein